MAAGGAAEAQARFGHSVKGLLTEKVTSCGTDVIALTKQVLKGSRSAEVSGGRAGGLQVPACNAAAGPPGKSGGTAGGAEVLCAGHDGSCRRRGGEC
ncbi:BLOC-1-related complex subunit 7 [Aix galericulata]|nr:BLOC-1-related complex subunit 7 [Aix galericulata]